MFLLLLIATVYVNADTMPIREKKLIILLNPINIVVYKKIVNKVSKESKQNFR
jgi:hypothetical protein